jgi:predicted alpha/beta hydrolase family esterase
MPCARRVEQDNWHRPDLRDWSKRLTNSIEKMPSAIIVAHSLGCALVAHLVGQQRDLPIAAALLVAPADVDSADHTPNVVRGFAPMPVARFSFPSMVVASTDDPYMSIDRARGFAERWGSIFIDVGAKGHINAAAGFGPWPLGEALLDELLSGTVRFHARDARVRRRARASA